MPMIARRYRLNGKQPDRWTAPVYRDPWPSYWLSSWQKYHESHVYTVKGRVLSTTDLPCPKHGPDEDRTICIWCREQFPTTVQCVKHMRACTGMTYDNWLFRIRFLQRLNSGACFKCPHCNTGFPLAKSCGRHSVQCRKRRQAAALSLNTNLWYDVDMDQIRS